MSVWEVLLIAAALSMDAVAVGMTDGLTEPKMRFSKMFFIALAFGFFQGAMPLLGFALGGTVTKEIESHAPFVAFVLLFLIGFKTLVDWLRERGEQRGLTVLKKESTGAARILLQAVATSIDALAVGITLLAVQTSTYLPFSVEWCAGLIGAVTFTLSLIAIFIGKRAGNVFADQAELFGAVVLMALGVKFLIEGLL